MKIIITILLQIIALSLVQHTVHVQGKLTKINYIPPKLASPKDVTSNLKQCNEVAFPPKASETDITSMGDLSDKYLTDKPIYLFAYGFTKLDKLV